MSRAHLAAALDESTSGWESDTSQPEGSTLQERWHARDTVDQLVSELLNTGRTKEAGIVEAILNKSEGDGDEQVIRAYVSSLWAEDWDSDEDASYDPR
jgi:hypothetical protein